VITLASGDDDLRVYATVKQKLCLGDTVWYDENLNGIQDEDSSFAVANVPVTLYKKDEANNWVEINHTVTDDNGEYLFCNLDRGQSYKVKFRLPEGYMATISNIGSINKDSDANKDGEIIVPFLEQIEEKDGLVGDFTHDIGIYCECNDYSVNPQEHKELSAPAFNLFGLVALLLSFTLLSNFARKEKEA
jgi:hypothetical protein